MAQSEFTLPHKINKLASLVPDLVVYQEIEKPVPRTEEIYGVLLFADISGFTALTERYSKISKKNYGANQLSRTLNECMTEIVKHILIAGGDILKFAGDALLALWKIDRNDVKEVISLVVECSFNIQKQYISWETDIGIDLQVKIGISAGKIQKMILGNDESEHYAVLGLAIDGIRKAEGLATAGDTVLSTNAWELCDKTAYSFKPIKDERFFKVRYIKRPTTFAVEKYLASVGCHLEYESGAKCSLRKATKLKPNQQLEEALAKYLPRTVLKKIENGEPLEFLSEVRPITTMFVNLQFKKYVPQNSQCECLQYALQYINEAIKKYRGRINKVLMFDKGCTFLCVFGLPGDKREDGCAKALHCALKVQKFCTDDLTRVETASVGVTHGPAFCGIIGHPLRKEYTVIGAKVNLSARLMMAYPGMVSCDQDVYHYSKLPPYFFSKLEPKPLKGIENPGPMYQFLGRKHLWMIGMTEFSDPRREEFPIIGREKELSMFEQLLREQRRDLYHVLLYEGVTGYGKTKLLGEICFRAKEKGFRSVILELAKIDSKQPYYAIRSMIVMLLQTESCKNYDERKEVIMSKISTSKIEKYLCLLNYFLRVEFSVSEEISHMDFTQQMEMFKDLLIEIVNQVLEKENLIFIIDNVHFIDKESMDIIIRITNQTPALFVMALQPLTLETPLYEKVQSIKSSKTLYMKLEELDSSAVKQLACSFLGVVQIPKPLEIILNTQCRGTPFFCIELLKCLCYSNLLRFEEIEDDNDLDMDSVINISQLSEVWQNKKLKRTAQTFEDFINARISKKCIDTEDEKKTHYKCLASENVDLQNIAVPLAIKDTPLSQLDSLNLAEQMVVKCAAIIGSTFLVKLLRSILPDGTVPRLETTLRSLVEKRVFCCASLVRDRWNPFLLQSQSSYTTDCACSSQSHKNIADGFKAKDDDIIQRRSDTELQCRMLAFSMPFVQETAYELWLAEPRRELHKKCITFLQNDAHRCSACGGGTFIFAHKLAAGVSNGNDSETHDEHHLHHKEESGPANALETKDHCEVMEENVSTQKATTKTCRKFPFPLSGIVKQKSRNQVSPTSQISKDTELLKKLDKVIEHYVEDTSQKVCKCAKIVESVTAPLANHFVKAGNLAMALHYLTESAAGAVSFSNYNIALPYLLQAKSILKWAKGSTKHEHEFTITRVKISRFEKACVWSLLGEVYYHMGDIKQSKICLKKALKILNSPFPSNIMGMSVKHVFEKIKHVFNNNRYKKQSEESSVEAKGHLYLRMSCLSFLWKIYALKSNARNVCEAAHLAATTEVNSAECTGSHLKKIQAYTDYFLCSQILGKIDEYKKYKDLAVQKCLAIPQSKEALSVIAYLAEAISTVNFFFGELTESIEFGYRALKVANLQNKSSQHIGFIPVLAKALFLTNRYAECVSALNYLGEIANKHCDTLAKGWHYAACLDILLLGGFAPKPFEECLDFFIKFRTDRVLMTENRLMLSVYSSIALWFARMKEWDLFLPAYRKAKLLVDTSHACFYSMNGYTKIFECEALLLHKAFCDDSAEIGSLYKKTRKLCKDLMNRCITCPASYARLCHLQAYIYLMFGKRDKGRDLLQKALDSCNKNGNKVEECWIKLSQKTNPS
ncbi:adenylate cyclase type 10 [Protopterus annectens]|uniref:adenylate cyclase type 10 n=1 Tax=Protopterus annectens TaxID=7888 RepID=UPI001CFC467F|nr:adenylate cyclase type 10 [Protopterus annectens]